ncbi:MAG: histidinol dehydrogenase, partial [Thermodesulfobacteriota bacterium]|nr:histidinol dehydrogenase [Thermodesulfobacteriota bacterium]
MTINFIITANLSDDDRKSLCNRPGVGLQELISQVVPIIEDVKKRGDAALSDYSLRFDGAKLSRDEFRVTDAAIE